MTKDDVLTHAKTTEEMVSIARAFILANFNSSSSYLIRALMDERKIKSPRDSANSAELGLAVSWHNAAVEAIRGLITDNILIPTSENYYKPQENIMYTHTVGGSHFRQITNGTINLEGVMLPICSSIATKPSSWQQ